jgi:hypothetical protein
VAVAASDLALSVLYFGLKAGDAGARVADRNALLSFMVELKRREVFLVPAVNATTLHLVRGEPFAPCLTVSLGTCLSPGVLDWVCFYPKIDRVTALSPLLRIAGDLTNLPRLPFASL